MTPSPRGTARLVALGVLATALAVAAELLPRALKLNQQFGSGFLTPEAYGTIVTLMIAGMIMGVLEPALRSAVAWALLVGLAPVAEMVTRMAKQGPGNLWPIAIVLALMIGWPPTLAGTLLGWNIRRLADRLDPTRWYLALLFLVAGTVGVGVINHLRSKGLPQAPKSAYWGVMALAPGPRAGASATHWCRFTSAIADLPEIRDSVTVLSSANFDRDRARNLRGDRWRLKLVRLAGGDSVELRASDGTDLLLGGRMTSPDEASGVWQCSDSLAGQPDSLLVVEGQWVLRRGSWPGSELNWPVISRPRSSPKHTYQPSPPERDSAKR